MNWKKTTGLAAAVFGLVAFFSVEASAQAPTVTATAIGNTITIDVALPPGTQTYTLGAGTAPGQYNIRILPQIPATSTHAVLHNVPNGTYYLRAAVGTAISNEAQVTVGAPSSAQGPTVTATASGNTITVDVALPPGTRTYTLGAGTASGQYNIGIVPQIPAMFTHFVLTVPNGTYYLRAAVGSAMSNEVQVTVGVPACTSAPTPPVLTVNVANAAVTLNWDAAAGATRYEIGWSRVPGITEFGDVSSTNSITRHAPYVGTFYARVRTTTACGTSGFSNEVAIQVASMGVGSGPRTPDPGPNQLLPMPSYALAVVQQIGRQYAGDLAAHRGPNCKGQNMWLFKLVRELRRYDSRWGLNWKRGYAGTFSTDIVTYNPGAVPDVGATEIYLADVLSGECESNIPVFNWQAVTTETWNAGRAGLCANRYCAMWTLDPYVAAGFLADEGEKKEQQ